MSSNTGNKYSGYGMYRRYNRAKASQPPQQANSTSSTSGSATAATEGLLSALSGEPAPSRGRTQRTVSETVASGLDGGEDSKRGGEEDREERIKRKLEERKRKKEMEKLREEEIGGISFVTMRETERIVREKQQAEEKFQQDHLGVAIDSHSDRAQAEVKSPVGQSQYRLYRTSTGHVTRKPSASKAISTVKADTELLQKKLDYLLEQETVTESSSESGKGKKRKQASIILDTSDLFYEGEQSTSDEEGADRFVAEFTKKRKPGEFSAKELSDAVLTGSSITLEDILTNEQLQRKFERDSEEERMKKVERERREALNRRIKEMEVCGALFTSGVSGGYPWILWSWNTEFEEPHPFFVMRAIREMKRAKEARRRVPLLSKRHDKDIARAFEFKKHKKLFMWRMMSSWDVYDDIASGLSIDDDEPAAVEQKTDRAVSSSQVPRKSEAKVRDSLEKEAKEKKKKSADDKNAEKETMREERMKKEKKEKQMKSVQDEELLKRKEKKTAQDREEELKVQRAAKKEKKKTAKEREEELKRLRVAKKEKGKKAAQDLEEELKTQRAAKKEKKKAAQDQEEELKTMTAAKREKEKKTAKDREEELKRLRAEKKEKEKKAAQDLEEELKTQRTAKKEKKTAKDREEELKRLRAEKKGKEKKTVKDREEELKTQRAAKKEKMEKKKTAKDREEELKRLREEKKEKEKKTAQDREEELKAQRAAKKVKKEKKKAAQDQEEELKTMTAAKREKEKKTAKDQKEELKTMTDVKREKEKKTAKDREEELKRLRDAQREEQKSQQKEETERKRKAEEKEKKSSETSEEAGRVLSRLDELLASDGSAERDAKYRKERIEQARGVLNTKSRMKAQRRAPTRDHLKKRKEIEVDEYQEVAKSTTARRLKAEAVGAVHPLNLLGADSEFMGDGEQGSMFQGVLQKAQKRRKNVDERRGRLGGSDSSTGGIGDLRPSESQPIFMWVKGRRRVGVMHLQKVDRSQMNSGDVFILDTDSVVWTWIGSKANRMERAKALDIVTSLKKKRSLKTNYIQMEEGVDDTDPKFWAHLGGKGKIKGADVGGDDRTWETGFVKATRFYKFENGKLASLVDGALPKIAQLDTAGIFVLTTEKPKECFVWIGQRSDVGQRREVKEAVKKLGKYKFYSLREHMEHTIFCERFKDWPSSIIIKQTETAQGNIARKTESLVELDPRKLFEFTPRRGEVVPDDGKGTKRVWLVRSYHKEELPLEEHGIFYESESYVILYKYLYKNRDVYIIYYWQGEDSSINEKGAAAVLSKELNEELGKMEDEVAEKLIRIPQGKESKHFIAVFSGGRMIVHSGKRKGPQPTGKRLYRIFGSSSDDTRTFETKCEIQCLDSSRSFVHANFSDRRAILWHGRGTYEGQRARSNEILDSFFSGFTIEEVEEGSGDKFLKLLGDRGVDRGRYCDAPYLTVSDEDRKVRLFEMNAITGVFNGDEVLEPTQADLNIRSAMLMDAWGALFLWLGPLLPPEEKKLAIKTTLRYAEDAEYAERRSVRMAKKGSGEPFCIELCREPEIFILNFPFWSNEKMERLQHLVKKDRGDSIHFGLQSGDGEGRVERRLYGGSPAGKVLKGLEKEFYTLDELLAKEKPEGVDRRRIEQYLNDKDFEKLFEIAKEAFNTMPRWKKMNLKKQKGLF